MAKLSNADALRKCRAAGLSVVEAVALARVHESEEDLADLIKASTDDDAADDDTAPKPGRMGQTTRNRDAGQQRVDRERAGKLADSILRG